MHDGIESFGQHLIAGCHGCLKLLLVYGSRELNSDVDYLAVYDKLLRSKSLLAGGVDLWVISEDALREYIALADPFVTEPLLNGSLVYGSPELLSLYHEQLRNIHPSNTAIRYLLSRSFQAYITACERLSYKEENNYMLNRDFWSTVSFSISYWCYARVYSQIKNSVLQLTEVISKSPKYIMSLWQKVQERKANSYDRNIDLLDEWTSILLKNTDFLEQ